MNSAANSANGTRPQRARASAAPRRAAADTITPSRNRHPSQSAATRPRWIAAISAARSELRASSAIAAAESASWSTPNAASLTARFACAVAREDHVIGARHLGAPELRSGRVPRAKLRQRRELALGVQARRGRIALARRNTARSRRARARAARADRARARRRGAACGRSSRARRDPRPRRGTGSRAGRRRPRPRAPRRRSAARDTAPTARCARPPLADSRASARAAAAGSRPDSRAATRAGIRRRARSRAARRASGGGARSARERGDRRGDQARQHRHEIAIEPGHRAHVFEHELARGREGRERGGDRGQRDPAAAPREPGRRGRDQDQRAGVCEKHRACVMRTRRPPRRSA